MNNLHNKTVVVHLDNYNSAVTCTLIDVKDVGVLVKLASGKLYFYPIARLAAIEEV